MKKKTSFIDLPDWRQTRSRSLAGFSIIGNNFNIFFSGFLRFCVYRRASHGGGAAAAAALSVFCSVAVETRLLPRPSRRAQPVALTR